ncbi:isochorismatase family protein [Salinicola salarius]|uniref:isochorismatase family protein n=1 Tax=Salinicola salarius TaxID=430457 RepID=UPI0023E36FBE|nr:isochorismatase family protein [Salinicola salarius]MDF3920128.1 isochorismatase family protein [Salinicola salarius]
MSRFSCKVCGGPAKIRSSKILAEGYRVLYLECKNLDCRARFKIDDIQQPLTEEEKIEKFGIKRLTLSSSALLIIDQQVCMKDRGILHRNNHDAEKYISELLAIWRKRELPVVHIRHISREAKSGFAPWQRGADFQDDFRPLKAEAVFEKNVPDAFIHTGLERWLRVRGIENLVVCGVSSENSVEGTVRTAGNLQFHVWVPERACYTFAKKDYFGASRTAEEVHAMAMANLNGEHAQVCGHEWLQLALKYWSAT